MQVDPTPYADINELLGLLLSQMQALLGDKLIGLYLFGSLVVGDFDDDISDIDLVAAISSDLDEQEFERLKAIHADIVQRYKQWDDRIEIGYIAVEHFKKAMSRHPIALISPGEPFHVKESGTDWIINRSVLREKGLALFGPAPETLVAPLTQADRMQTVRDNVQEWREWIAQTEMIHERDYQSFMILTMCRELYRLYHEGHIASKKAAAHWAQQEWPEWASLIRQALAWREAYREEQTDDDATLPETLRFVHFALAQCERDPGISKPVV
jgi:predicted nucleotidyltransferase